MAVLNKLTLLHELVVVVTIHLNLFHFENGSNDYTPRPEKESIYVF